MKLCSRCGEEKSEGSFSNDKGTKDGLACWCKKCRAEEASRYYTENKKAVLKRSKDYYHRDRAVRRQRALDNQRTRSEEWKKHIPQKIACSECGYDKHFAALEFHHVDPATKEYGISRLMHSNLTPERVKLFKKELKKCIILCSNCHRIHHFGEA